MNDIEADVGKVIRLANRMMKVIEGENFAEVTLAVGVILANQGSDWAMKNGRTLAN